MEHRGLIGADAGGDEHVAELRTGGIGDHPFDVVLHAADGGGEERGGGAHEADEAERVGRVFHQRRHARHQEHAGGDHGGGVDEGRHRGRAFHRVRQPHMQAELGRFAHRADEQQHADDFEGAEIGAEQVVAVVLVLADGGENAVEADGAEDHEQQGDAEREAEIADAVDDEGLHGGRTGGRAVVVVADQQVAREADAFPAEEQLQQVIRRHQHEHGEGEQAEIAEELPDGVVVRHVAGAVDVDQGGHAGDHGDHDRGQRIVAQRPFHMEAAGFDPGAEADHPGGNAGIDQIDKGRDAADRGEDHAGDGDGLRGAVADLAAEQQRDQGADQRGENGECVQHGSALHHVDVFDFNRAAIAEVDHHDGQPD